MKHRKTLDAPTSRSDRFADWGCHGSAENHRRTGRFLLLDNNYSNYFPCFRAIESRLTDGATVVADNVGIGAAGMADYLNHVRSHYESRTHWFETDLPWVKRDAMEVTIYRKSR